MPDVVHFDLGDVFVTVERLRRPELIDQPIVIGGRPEGPGRVAAASAEACAEGVTVGLPLREAAARCRRAHFLPGDLGAYREIVDRADLRLRDTFTHVEWVTLNEAYVHAADLRPGWTQGGWTQVGWTQVERKGEHRPHPPNLLSAVEATQIALRRELGLTVACGIGASKVAARTASHLARPSGLLYLFPGYDARFLAPLALDLLPDLPVSLQEALTAQGVDTIGALARLPDAAADTLGAEATLWRRLAAGDDDRPVRGTSVPRAVTIQARLDGLSTSAEGLAGRVRELARELASELTSRTLLTHQVTVRVTDTAEGVHTATVSPAVATASAGALMDAAVKALRRALGWPRAASRLSVRASSLTVCDVQPSLFPASDLEAGRAVRGARTTVAASTAPHLAPRRRAVRGLRDLERILLGAGDRVLTRQAS